MKTIRRSFAAFLMILSATAVGVGATGGGTAEAASCWGGTYLDGGRTWSMYCNSGRTIWATCKHRVTGATYGLTMGGPASFNGQRLYAPCSPYGSYAVATNGFWQ